MIKTKSFDNNSYDAIEFTLPSGTTIALRFYPISYWIPRFAPGDRLPLGVWDDGFGRAIVTPWFACHEGDSIDW